jgi:tetratricopeptide (TPR) repeat protein
MLKIAKFCIFIILFIEISYVLSLDIKSELEKVYSLESDYSIKKHLKLAISHWEKGNKKSFLEEIDVIKAIKKKDIEVYNNILNELNGEKQGVSLNTDNEKNDIVMAKFEKANKFYRMSNLSGAILELQDIINLDKENKLAKQFIEDIKAEKFIFDDTRPFQNLVKELYEKGMVFYRKGAYKDAIEKFERAKELDPANTQIKKYLNLSNQNLLTMKQKEDEEKLIEQADKLRSEGNIEKARLIYEKVYAQNPANTHAQFYLNEFDKISENFFQNAKNLFEQNKIKESYEKIKEAIEFNNKNFEAIEFQKKIKLKLATFLDEEKKKKEANKLYNKAVEYFGKGDYEKAIELWEEVLAINPDDAQAKKNIELANQKLKENESNKAKKIEKLLEQAELLVKQGLLEKAKGKYEYVLRLDETNEKAKQGLINIQNLNSQVIGEKIDKR